MDVLREKIEQLREFLGGPAGRWLGVGAAALGLMVIGLSIRSNFGASEAEALSGRRWFVCQKTGKSFRAAVGASWPVDSPHSGEKTGYPAEECYWTASGTIKSEPTRVLANHYLGVREPTFCPDCGRLVVAPNPGPREGHPPPTRAEHLARRAAPAGKTAGARGGARGPAPAGEETTE